MGRVGFDYAAYYGAAPPNPRSANKSLPHGSVPIWNVYDHGVNNAEGGLRWPAELYRLNGSLAAGVRAMRLLTSQIDTYHGQVQGTMCADEVFCGRDPERGVETCTVVEQMASYEHGFAALGLPELRDRVERLGFNALPAALTADMWTHVYVHQANSVYAGVTHPQSSRGHAHTHAHAAAGESARTCPRGACHAAGAEAHAHVEGGDDDDESGSGGGTTIHPPPSGPRPPRPPGAPPTSPAPPPLTGGPAAFSEIQKANYFGTSHFPCCVRTQRALITRSTRTHARTLITRSTRTHAHIYPTHIHISLRRTLAEKSHRVSTKTRAACTPRVRLAC